MRPSASSCRGVGGGPQGRPRGLRGHSHERRPELPYQLLWGERQLVSVANLTRQDGLDFLKIAEQAGVRTQTTAFPLAEANNVLALLGGGKSSAQRYSSPDTHDDFEGTRR